MGMLTRRTLEAQRARMRQSAPEPVVEVPVDRLAALKAEADALGMKYHHMIGAEKLAALIAEYKSAHQ